MSGRGATTQVGKQQQQQRNTNKKPTTSSPKNTTTTTSTSTTTTSPTTSALQDKDAEIRDFESKKQQANLGLEQCESLVKNTLGHLERVKDIDQHWVNQEHIQIMSFLPQDNTNDNNASADEVLLYLNSDLSRLLKMPYKQFWSHMLLNNSLLDFLESFLRYASRPYTRINLCGNISAKQLGSQDFRDSKHMLERRVMAVLTKLSMQQEKNGQYIGREYYAKSIYNRGLFDVPKMIDICALYGSRCKEQISTMVQGLFDIQPHYYDDLSKTPAVIARSLQELNQTIVQVNNIDLIKIEDTSSYLLDIVYSVNCFLKVFPAGCHSFEEDESFIPLLVYFYERIIPIYECVIPSPQLKQQLQPIKSHIICIIHTIIKHCYTNKMDQIAQGLSEPCTQCNKRQQKNQRLTYSVVSKGLLDFLGRLTEQRDFDKTHRSKQFGTYFDTITFGSILNDYEDKSALSSKLISLYSLDDTIDSVRLSYFVNMMGKHLPKDKPQPAKQQQPAVTTTSKAEPQPTVYDLSNITQIQDIFPDFGDKFIFSCLKFFNDNVETTINALFEQDSLPAQLKSKNKKETFANPSTPPLATIPSPVQSTSTTSTTSTSTTTTTSTSTTSTSRTNDLGDVYEMAMGKRSVELPLHMSNSIKSYITNYDYENMYDDEYDDSLDAFLGVGVQDGESLNTEEQDEKKSEENAPLTKNTPFAKNAAPFTSKKNPSAKAYASKNHHRKDKSLKKTMGGFNNQPSSGN
ncbi:hypothetical protein SAMD00019534_060740 [Acytostelium subglobosum LB1]|uniref:hypothetical protein n=1 Tax=Acytostelium subglobosum LB1 TaxID=1410327 RepID=UPI000645087D|nr:hypothetical protein SAMD00019534_060740 [Acytostelium subglobosum LB1]GAM22899.1 hypothetical protein SAMD00019534_060740 [Acytostelium subglobosum LB1]|eukprot:XP_012754126.1 hypothetical protein SAMD00019534_060740 [Acytostelium subglobosum LB1]